MKPEAFIEEKGVHFIHTAKGEKFDLYDLSHFAFAHRLLIERLAKGEFSGHNIIKALYDHVQRPIDVEPSAHEMDD